MADSIAKTKVPGQLLTRGTDKKWTEKAIPDLYEELKVPATNPRILCILPSDDIKPFERLACNDKCRESLTTEYKFPKSLFDKTWYLGNGFADLRQHEAANLNLPLITVSWVRVLVKIIKKPDLVTKKDYYWHEMTFLVYDSGEGAPTIICCDIDDRFHKKMVVDLDSTFKDKIDWKDIHVILFRQMTCEIDYSVWACSNAVRGIEKNRPNSTTNLHSDVEFPKIHDLLRHALHTSETLQAACLNLKDWLNTYKRITQILNTTGQTIEPDEYHYDMLNCFQLIQSLLKRADSNEARLRNEINLAFNTVSQQDAKAVRIISVASLLFLPATFVSTLFSMSFFNFQPAYQNKWGVSPKIWIYFAVAAPLTIFTIVIWFQISRILTWLHGMTWYGNVKRWWKGKPKKSI